MGQLYDQLVPLLIRFLLDVRSPPWSVTLLPFVSYLCRVGPALDADHIRYAACSATSDNNSEVSPSAIDNATRSLIGMGQLPVTCGLYFSLGHSTIVIVVVSISESPLPNNKVT